MDKFVATAKRALWDFVELAFLLVLSLVLIFLLLGQNAGPYVTSVADNVTKFAASAGAGLLGALIVLAIVFLVLRRMGSALAGGSPPVQSTARRRQGTR
ncbi:MAG: hypothetical protein IRY89_11295 [Pseudolabrys sp.]|nr:hypothetical protein [Pseudolabrys sp.]